MKGRTERRMNTELRIQGAMKQLSKYFFLELQLLLVLIDALEVHGTQLTDDRLLKAA